MARRHHSSHSQDEHGHSFWISFCDLMANLIFIFLLIVAILSMQFQKEQTAFVAVKAELQSPMKTRAKILDDLKLMLKNEGLEVETLHAEGILRLSESALSFPPARAFPEDEKLANLGLLARALTRVIPCYSKASATPNLAPSDLPSWCQPATAAPAATAYSCQDEYRGSIETVMIEGHTDASTVRARAGYRDNLALSAARATTVLRLLKLCDPQLGSLYNRNAQPILGVSGYSDLRPVYKDAPRDPRNRRIDIRLVMDLPDNAFEAELRATTSNSKDEDAITL